MHVTKDQVLFFFLLQQTYANIMLYYKLTAVYVLCTINHTPITTTTITKKKKRS